MKPSVIYRIAAVVLLLFAVAHTLGFTQSDAKWGIDPLLAALRSQSFDIAAFERTWWDFYLAAGLTAAVFYVFAAVLAWQLGSLRPETLAQMQRVAWAFAVAFAAVTAVSWMYLFLIPIVFSTVVAICLITAAWLSSQDKP